MSSVLRRAPWFLVRIIASIALFTSAALTGSPAQADGDEIAYIANDYHGVRLMQASAEADQGWSLLAGGPDRMGSEPGQFRGVRGLGVDSQGNVYVSDAGNGRLQKLSPQGVPLAQWGSFPARIAQSYGMSGVAVDRQDNIYVQEDFFGDRIQKFSPQGQLIAQWGSPGPPRQGPPGFGGYEYPRSLTVDGQGNSYRVIMKPAPDGLDFRIQKLSSQGTQLAQWGTTGDGPGEFRYPNGLAVDGDGNVYVADVGNGSVQKLSPEGTPLAQWSIGGSGTDQLGSPLALAVDAQANIYVVFAGGLEKHSPLGELLVRWGGTQGGDQPGQFNMASSVAVDKQGNIYVGDEGNSRIHKRLASAAQPDAALSERTATPPTASAPMSDSATGSPPPAAVASAVPDTLTGSVRADILAAVDRANAAWTSATETLDPSGLSDAVAVQELTNDLAELDKLRSQGRTRKNVNTAFAVTDVTLDGPGHAIVDTRETWYAEIDEAASGRLVQRTPAATYSESYSVEYLNGGWIVTLNDVS